MAVRKIKSKINSWKPKDWQMIIERDGKLFVCHFDRMFGHEQNLRPYNRFLIGKESYINQLDTITSYANFFVNNYDPECELVMGYLKVKFALDKEKIYTTENMESYIDFLYEVLFTNTMVEKIVKMTEENYIDDIEVDGVERKKYVKNEKKHLESLEFTNEHIKILLSVSFCMKIMSPCIFHYFQLNNIKVEKDSEIIFMFYKRLFTLFGYGDTFELVEPLDGDEIIIQSGITPKEMEDIAFDKGLLPMQNGLGITYEWMDGDKKLIYRKKVINIYNKLYVYVENALAPTLNNLLNCWDAA